MQGDLNELACENRGEASEDEGSAGRVRHEAVGRKDEFDRASATLKSLIDLNYGNSFEVDPNQKLSLEASGHGIYASDKLHASNLTVKLEPIWVMS